MSPIARFVALLYLLTIGAATWAIWLVNYWL